jgi:hypothetical protein
MEIYDQVYFFKVRPNYDYLSEHTIEFYSCSTV